MAAVLLAAWRKTGRATNEGELFRLCLQESFNKLQRSNRKPQVKFSVYGDVRSGRPRKRKPRIINLPVISTNGEGY